MSVPSSAGRGLRGNRRVTTWQPPHRIAIAAAQQTWESVAFVHWRYRPAEIADLLPAGVEVDTIDGAAWVGLTPFRLQAAMLPLVARPAVAAAEINVRTYVRVRGLPGIWFLSLELDKPMVARSLRAMLRLPYRTSQIAVEHRPEQVVYRQHRQDPRPARVEMTVDLGRHVEPGEVRDLDVFLLARWRAFTRALGTIISVPVEHRPWPLRRAELSDISGDLLAAADLSAPQGEPDVRFSDGVHARLGFPRPTFADNAS